MDPAIRPLWRDTDDFKHKFAGIAVTVRYLPTNRRVGKMTARGVPQVGRRLVQQAVSGAFHSST